MTNMVTITYSKFGSVNMDGVYISFTLFEFNLTLAISVIFFMLWRYTQPYKGPGVWLMAALIQMAGLLMSLYIAYKEEIFYAVVDYGLNITSNSLLVLGVYRFFNLSENRLLITVCPFFWVSVIFFLWYIGLREAEWGIITYSILSSVLLFKVFYALWWVANKSTKIGLERILSISFFFLMMVALLEAAVALINISGNSVYLNEIVSISYFVSYYMDDPVWIVNLMGLALLVMNQVILDSKKNAKSAQIMANRFEKLMSITNGGVFLAKNGYVSDANLKMSQLFSLSLNELRSKSVLSFFDLSKALNEGIVEQISKSDGQFFDRLAICQDGNTFFIEFSIATLDDGFQVGEIRDINVRKTMEDELRLLVFRDALTGAFNRRFFFERAELELARFYRFKNKLCFAIFDIDFFKKINDTYGHGVGDYVLKKFSHFCLDSLRETDTFARYGGEEFVLIMPDTDSSQAMIVLDRLSDSWKNEYFSHQERTFNSTISIGLVQVNDIKPIEHWLDLADEALYRAKKQGRDRIIIAD